MVGSGKLRVESKPDLGLGDRRGLGGGGLGEGERVVGGVVRRGNVQRGGAR